MSPKNTASQDPNKGPARHWGNKGKHKHTHDTTNTQQSSTSHHHSLSTDNHIQTHNILGLPTITEGTIWTLFDEPVQLALPTPTSLPQGHRLQAYSPNTSVPVTTNLFGGTFTNPSDRTVLPPPAQRPPPEPPPITPPASYSFLASTGNPGITGKSGGLVHPTPTISDMLADTQLELPWGIDMTLFDETPTPKLNLKN